MAVGNVLIRRIKAEDDVLHVAFAVRRFQRHNDPAEVHNAGFNGPIAQSKKFDRSSVRHFSKRLFGHVCFRLRERGTKCTAQDDNQYSFHIEGMAYLFAIDSFTTVGTIAHRTSVLWKWRNRGYQFFNLIPDRNSGLSSDCFWTGLGLD